MQNSQNFEQRINELEMKISFQEQMIDELNQSLIDQQFIIDKLQIQLRHLTKKLNELQPSNIANQSEEIPPPHY